MKRFWLALAVPGAASIAAVLLLAPRPWHIVVGIVILGASGAWSIYRTRKP